MKEIITKSILPVIVTTGVVASAIVTSKVIDNKNFASEISNQKNLSYTERETVDEVKNTAVVESEKEVSESTEKLKVTQTKSKSVEPVKQVSQKEVENAKKEVQQAKEAVKEAEKALQSATTEQEKVEAQAKVESAKKEEEKAEQAKKEVEEQVKQVEEIVKETEPEKTETESKTNSSSQNATAPSPVENSIPSVSANTNNLETVKKAIENTINAKNMTVVNNIENSTRKFNKITGEELATYRSALSLTEKAGTLYSYKVNSTKTISLFKENGSSEWKMVFTGKKSIGVIELELIKKAHSVEATGEGSYNVKISYSDAKSWLMNYYGSSSVSGEVTIAVKTSNGYVKSIKGTVGGRAIDLTLSDVGSTNVPSRDSLGIDENTINKLEEEYKARNGCERENDYWVCGPNKHVSQHNF